MDTVERIEALERELDKTRDQMNTLLGLLERLAEKVGEMKTVITLAYPGIINWDEEPEG